MGCTTCGGAKAVPPEEQLQYSVTLPDGKVEVVAGLHAAKVAVTKAGGGRYEPVR